MMSLIGTLIVVIIVTVFAGFNLNNKCDINLIYRTFNDVPVFLAIMIAFVAGVVVALPYVFFHRHAKKEKVNTKEDNELKKEQNEKSDKKPDTVGTNDKGSDVKTDAGGSEKKFSLFGRKKKDDEKSADASSVQEEKPVAGSPEAAARLEEIDKLSPRI